MALKINTFDEYFMDVRYLCEERKSIRQIDPEVLKAIIKERTAFRFTPMGTLQTTSNHF